MGNDDKYLFFTYHKLYELKLINIFSFIYFYIYLINNLKKKFILTQLFFI
jgi:hypothetical protein